MDQTQNSQESEYRFPYHHLLEPYPNVILFKYWSGVLNYLFTQDLIFDQLSQYQFKSVIDVGCGDGKVIKEIAKRFPNARSAGVDYSEQAISLARLIVPNVTFFRHNIVESPLEEKFDIAVSVEVVEHIPPSELNQFISAMARLINPGGKLILTTPHKNQPMPEKHYQHFDKESLGHYLDSEFVVEQTLYINGKSTFQTRFISRLLWNRFFILSEKRIVKMLYLMLRRRLQKSTSSNATGLMVVCKNKGLRH